MSALADIAAQISTLLGAIIVVAAIAIMTQRILLRAHGGPAFLRIAEREAPIARSLTIAAIVVVVIRLAALL